MVSLEVYGVYSRDQVLESSFRPFRTDVMLGLSAIRLLGGVTNSSARQRMFWGEYVCYGEKNPSMRFRKDIKQGYESELRGWIKQGRLLEYDECSMVPPKGHLPIMAVGSTQQEQSTVGARLANRFIEAFTRNLDVYAEMLRQWKQMGYKPAIIVLHEAYLHLKADKTL